MLIDDLLENNLSDTQIVASNNTTISGYARAAVLISHSELADLVSI